MTSQKPTKYLPFKNADYRQQSGEDKNDPEKSYYRARISSNRLDSHYSYMDESTLENFARESAEGVSVLDSHNHRTVGIGRSTSGELIDGEVYSDFYLLKNLDLNNQSFQSSNDFDKAIKSGMLTDVSVGFYGHTERCNICNKELWRDGCHHWPGFKYPVEDEDGNQKIVTATTTIVNGHLSEFSLVYDGALEGAEIVERAKRSNFRFNNDQRKDLQERYGVEIKSIEPPETKKEPDPIPVESNTQNMRGITIMSTTKDERIERLEADNELLAKRCKDAEDAAKLKFRAEAERDQLQKEVTEAEERAESHEKLYEKSEERVKALESKIEDLQPKADSFDRFKDEEIELALESFRAANYGIDETSEKYLRTKRSLERSISIDDIRDDRDKWEGQAVRNTPDGPQLDSTSKDDEPPVVTSTTKPTVTRSPASAF